MPEETSTLTQRLRDRLRGTGWWYRFITDSVSRRMDVGGQREQWLIIMTDEPRALLFGPNFRRLWLIHSALAYLKGREEAIIELGTDGRETSGG